MIGQTNIYQTLFEEMHDGVLICTPDGKVLQANQATTILLGFETKEICSLNIQDFFVEPEQAIEALSVVNEAIPVRHFEVELRQKNETIVQCEIALIAQPDHNDAVLSNLLIIKDVSQQVQVEKTVEKRLQLEAGLSGVAACLFSDSETAMDDALRHLLKASDVGRISMLKAVISETNELYYELTHEVDADVERKAEVDHEFQFPKTFFLTPGFEKVRQDFMKGKEATLNLSDLSGPERALFEFRNVKSMLLLPIQMKDELTEVMLFSSLDEERRWDVTEVDLLHVAASMFGTYLMRKRARVELEKQQHFLRQVIDLNPEYVFVKDVNGRYTLANQAFASRYDMSPDELIGKTDEELGLLPAKKAQTFRDAEKMMMTSKQDLFSVEDRVLLDDGSERWLQTYKRPILNQDDTPTHLLAISVDVTKQKEAVQLVKEREQLLQTILNTLPGAVYWKDQNLVYQGCNDYFANIVGLTTDEIVGKTDFELSWLSDAESIQKEDAKIIQKGASKIGVIETRREANGGMSWIETNKIALIDDSGNVTGLVGSFRDISERMNLQEQVRTLLDVRSRQVALSTEIAQEIANAPDLEDLYKRIVSEVKEQLGYYHVQLLQYDPALDTVVLIQGYGEAGQKMKALNHAMPMGIGLIGTAAATGQSVLRPDVRKDSAWRANPLLPRTEGEVAIPIKSGDKVLGVLDIQSERKGELTEDDQLLLEGLCGQIAIAIETTNLRQELESQVRELMQLQRQLSRDGWNKYNDVVDVKELDGFQYDHAGIRPYNVQDAINELNEFESHTNQSNTIITKPLAIRGQIIGQMGLKDNLEFPLDADEERLLETIASEVAGALEAARLFEEIEKSLGDQARLAKELETVAQVSTAAATVLDSNFLLQSVVDLVKDSFNLYHAHVYIISEKGDTLNLVAGSGAAGQLMALEGHSISVTEDSLVARTARTREGVLVNNVRRSIDFLPNPMLPHTQAEIAVPMIVGDKIIGVLDMQSNSADAFAEQDLRIYKILASQVAVAYENAKQYTAQVETSKKLREVDLLKNEFLASMSHELRTPLNSIIGFADVLLEGLDGELNERMEEDVRLIRQSGAHLRELIGDILDMSKIEAGKMELRYESVDIAQMANDIMKTAHPLAQDKSLDLLLDLDEAIQFITADRTRLRQVLWNIMGNAIKFTQKGSVTLRIAAKAQHLLVSIKDTGIGIDEANIPIVFEQFRQVDGSLERVAGGTGLGMPISKKLVELHGGDIWVESVVGQGSTFFFTLPYNPPMKA